MTTIDVTEPDTEPEITTGDFAERFFETALSAMTIQAAYLGNRLGWYRALAAADGLTGSSSWPSWWRKSGRFIAAWASDRPYDVVFAFECIHDMPDPVAVLAAMRRLAGEDGVVMVMDERTEHDLTPGAGGLEALFYGFSLTCCLPDGRSEQPSVATGTAMRASTFSDYARQAGFTDVEVLPIDHEMFRFYRLVSPGTGTVPGE